MRAATFVAAATLLVAGCAVAEEPASEAVPSRPPAVASVSPAPPPPEVSLDVTGWWAWALLDRRTGQIHGSANRAFETSTTESMVKAWLAADYLAAVDRDGRNLTGMERSTIRRALRVSDDAAAEWLYLASGGNASIRRMIRSCQLTDTRSHPGRWALTRITAQDASRLGGCLADGAVLDAQWTNWLLREMRSVASSNAFGIREAFAPEQAARIAVKNGWTARSDTGQWHVACLGVWHHWSLAVLTRYPVQLGLRYGAAICRDATRQLF
ncbi:MAG: serine hydrolase [Micromonosporaceae bacterium]